MKIFCQDYSFAELLRREGHEVLSPDLPPGLASLPLILKKNAFAPDLVIQQERLGRRVFFYGLDELDCPSVFISVDTHLNLFWQRYYAKLFDLALTPHLSLFEALPPEDRHPQVKRLGHNGYELGFMPHAQRPHGISFCGVLDEHRPLRRAMVEMLAGKFGLYRPEAYIGLREMLELFGGSRLVPNESIAREVNFRLYEGASAGALVLSQDVGDDQDADFAPGKEFEIYSHALELEDKAGFYLGRPDASERLGRAGRERVLKEHLPAHRLARLMDYAGRAGQAGLRGSDAQLHFWLVLLQLARHGSHHMSAAELWAAQADLPRTPLKTAMSMILLAEAARHGSALYPAGDGAAVARFREMWKSLCAVLVAEEVYADDFLCNMAGSLSALLLKESELARVFALRQIRLESGGSATSPDRPYEYYIFWAVRLLERGRTAAPGFFFRLGSGVPDNAYHCLLMAQQEAGEDDREYLELLHKVGTIQPGFEHMDMGYLARLSLGDESDWRLQAEYGLSALKCFKPEPGVFEIRQAAAKAAARGEEEEFMRALAGFPSSRYILRILKV